MIICKRKNYPAAFLSGDSVSTDEEKDEESASAAMGRSRTLGLSLPWR